MAEKRPPFAEFLDRLVEATGKATLVAAALQMDDGVLSNLRNGKRRITLDIMEKIEKRLPTWYPEAVIAYVQDREGISLSINSTAPARPTFHRLAYALMRYWDSMTPRQARAIADYLLLGEELP